MSAKMSPDLELFVVCGWGNSANSCQISSNIMWFLEVNAPSGRILR